MATTAPRPATRRAADDINKLAHVGTVPPAPILAIEDALAFHQAIGSARKEARLRHRMARDILAGRYSGAGDGLHVWLELPTYWNASQLAHAAGSEGIAITPAEAFANGSGSVNAIRISLGCIRDRGRLQAGLQRLSHLLARRPEPFSPALPANAYARL